MSRKKGVCVSLAEFAAETYGNALPPTESRGRDRLESSHPSRDRLSGDRWTNDRPSGYRPMRSECPTDEAGRPPRFEDEDYLLAPRKYVPASSLSSSSLQPSFSSFGRSRESKAAPDNWRDQVSGSGSKSEAATGGAWKPGCSRTQSATQPAAQPKTRWALVAEQNAAMSWGEEEGPIEMPEQVKVDEEKLAAFTGRFAILLQDETKRFDVFAKKAAENFTVAELNTNIPLQKAIELLLQFLAHKTESLAEMLSTVNRCAVLFQSLQTGTKAYQLELGLQVETRTSETPPSLFVKVPLSYKH